MASSQFGFTGSNPARKLRVVAKIRRFSDQETNFGTVDWVSVNTENSGDVTISFKEQSSRYCFTFLNYSVFSFVIFEIRFNYVKL
jgi:hypothetical protein